MLYLRIVGIIQVSERKWMTWGRVCVIDESDVHIFNYSCTMSSSWDSGSSVYPFLVFCFTFSFFLFSDVSLKSSVSTNLTRTKSEERRGLSEKNCQRNWIWQDEREKVRGSECNAHDAKSEKERRYSEPPVHQFMFSDQPGFVLVKFHYSKKKTHSYFRQFHILWFCQLYPFLGRENWDPEVSKNEIWWHT